VFDMNETICLLDVATQTPTNLGVPGVAGSFSPDGQKIAFLAKQPAWSGIAVMNKDGSNVRQLSAIGYNSWEAPQWTADGQWLFGATEGGGFRFVNVTTGQSIRMPSTFPMGQLRPPFGH